MINKEKLVSVAVLVLVAGAVTALAYFGYNKTNSPVAVEGVAKVNGETITKSVFDAQLASAILSLKTQGVDTESADSLAKIRTQVMEDLINNELVLQGVAKAGITISAEEVEKQFQILVAQAGGADKLKEQLTAANLTEEQFRANISKQLSIQAYLLRNIDIASATATDAEAQQFYDTNVKGQTGAPAYKDIVEQIKQQIIGSKQQLLVNTFIASLRAAAEVETNL